MVVLICKIIPGTWFASAKSITEAYFNCHITGEYNLARESILEGSMRLPGYEEFFH